MMTKTTSKLAALILAASALAIAGGCATAPTGPPVLNASDPAAIQGAMPTVTVVGEVEKTSESGSVLIINFKDTDKSQFYAVVLEADREAVNAGFGGDVAKAITGKTVRVTGRVVLYRGKPEIIISRPEQLVVG